jgi:hypothetical protein
MESLCSRLSKLPGIEVVFIDQPSGLKTVDFRAEKNGAALNAKEGEKESILKEDEKDSLELMLEKQSRNQIRSDYRRSLGNENRRRYLE